MAAPILSRHLILFVQKVHCNAGLPKELDHKEDNTNYDQRPKYAEHRVF